MKGLVVVHTDNRYVDPETIGIEAAARNASLFNRIAAELRQNWHRRKGVYYLPESEAGLCNTYPAIRNRLTRATIIPGLEGNEWQFLRTKRRLITQGVRDVYLCGVSYDICVSDLCALIRGKASDTPMFSYAITAERMGWTKEYFDRICGVRINAQIIDNLTDKRINE